MPEKNYMKTETYGNIKNEHFPKEINQSSCSSTIKYNGSIKEESSHSKIKFDIDMKSSHINIDLKENLNDEIFENKKVKTLKDVILQSKKNSAELVMDEIPLPTNYYENASFLTNREILGILFKAWFIINFVVLFLESVLFIMDIVDSYSCIYVIVTWMFSSFLFVFVFVFFYMKKTRAYLNNQVDT